MKQFKLFNSFILIILIISFFGYLRIYNSWVQQREILSDVNNNTFNKSWEFIQDIEVDFPNLSVTAFPLKAAKAQYYLFNDSVVKGMELIDEVISEKSNPYIMLPEALKAKYYNTIGQIDSATYYSRKAFNGLPRNPLHYVELSRNFVQKNQIDSVIKYFKQIRYPFEKDIYRLFLAAVLPHKDSFNDETVKFIDEVALEGIKFSANDKEEYNNLLRLTSFLVLHGEDSVQKMLEIESQALSLLNDNMWKESLDLYTELDQIISTNYLFKENIVLASFNLKDFNNVVKKIYEIEELNHKLNVSQQFMMGISLWNTTSKSLGCERILIASKMGLDEANNALRILCKL